jgi:hypothetical protein
MAPRGREGGCLRQRSRGVQHASRLPHAVKNPNNNPLASRSVDRCPMTRDASAPTAAGGCPADRKIMPALSMPYNGGRVDSALRTFSPDEGRDAYAK